MHVHIQYKEERFISFTGSQYISICTVRENNHSRVAHGEWQWGCVPETHHIMTDQEEKASPNYGSGITLLGLPLVTSLLLKDPKCS